MKETIYAIMCGQVQVGYGFIANGFFLTAAHVITDYKPCIVYIEGLKIELSNMVPEFVGIGKNNGPISYIDLAFYKIDKVKGGLCITDYIPRKNEMLESLCLRDVSTPGSKDPIYELDVVPAYSLGEAEGNYFHCKCNRDEGSSGSPLLKDNHVIGIMHGGRMVKDLIVEGFLSEEEKRAHNLEDDDKICSFLRISAFMSLIESVEKK